MNRKAFHQYLYEGEELYKPSESFRSGIFVVTEHDGDIPPNERGLLENILRSINIDISTITSLNDERASIDLDKFRGSQFFVFGLNPGEFAWMPEQLYSITTINGNTVIASDSLTVLEKSKELKMKLWGELKSLG